MFLARQRPGAPGSGLSSHNPSLFLLRPRNTSPGFECILCKWILTAIMPYRIPLARLSGAISAAAFVESPGVEASRLHFKQAQSVQVDQGQGDIGEGEAESADQFVGDPEFH